MRRVANVTRKPQQQVNRAGFVLENVELVFRHDGSDFPDSLISTVRNEKLGDRAYDVRPGTAYISLITKGEKRRFGLRWNRQYTMLFAVPHNAEELGDVQRARIREIRIRDLQRETRGKETTLRCKKTGAIVFLAPDLKPHGVPPRQDPRIFWLVGTDTGVYFLTRDGKWSHTLSAYDDEVAENTDWTKEITLPWIPMDFEARRVGIWKGRRFFRKDRQRLIEETLGVQKYASEEEIHAAYEREERKFRSTFHPDRISGEVGAGLEQSEFDKWEDAYKQNLVILASARDLMLNRAKFAQRSAAVAVGNADAMLDRFRRLQKTGVNGRANTPDHPGDAVLVVSEEQMVLAWLRLLTGLQLESRERNLMAIAQAIVKQFCCLPQNLPEEHEPAIPLVLRDCGLEERESQRIIGYIRVRLQGWEGTFERYARPYQTPNPGTTTEPAAKARVADESSAETTSSSTTEKVVVECPNQECRAKNRVDPAKIDTAVCAKCKTSLRPSPEPTAPPIDRETVQAAWLLVFDGVLDNPEAAAAVMTEKIGKTPAELGHNPIRIAPAITNTIGVIKDADLEQAVARACSPQTFTPPPDQPTPNPGQEIEVWVALLNRKRIGSSRQRIPLAEALRAEFGTTPVGVKRLLYPELDQRCRNAANAVEIELKGDGADRLIDAIKSARH